MIGPRSSKKPTNIHPLRGRARADLPTPPQTVVALVPKVGSVGKHRGAVGAKPVCARNAAIPGARNRSPFLRKSSRCEAPFRYLVVQTVGLAMLIRIARSAAQYLVAEQLEVHFPLPGRSRETHSARLVHHRNDPTATANRLIPGDFLHFKSFKRR